MTAWNRRRRPRRQPREVRINAGVILHLQLPHTHEIQTFIEGTVEQVRAMLPEEPAAQHVDYCEQHGAWSVGVSWDMPAENAHAGIERGEAFKAQLAQFQADLNHQLETMGYPQE